MFRKIANEKIKILVYVMIIFIFILTLFGSINIYKSCHIINNQVEITFISITRNIRKSFDQYFKNAEDEAEHCKQIIPITIDNKKFRAIAPNAYKYPVNKIPYIQTYIDSVLSPVLLYSATQVEGLQGIYFNFDPELLKHKNLIGPWYIKASQSNKLKPIYNGLTSEMFPVTRPDLEWFYQPKKLKKGVWSKPYVDFDLKINMITYSTPVYLKKKFLGIMGIDISMEALKDFIYKFKQYKTGKIYLVNDDNKIIFAKDYKSLESTNLIDKNLYSFINKNYVKHNKNINKNDVELLRTSKNLYAISELYNGFILVLEVSKNELYGEVSRLMLFTSLSLALAILISILITIEAYTKVKKINIELTHKEKLIAIGTMTAGIAHEMNNPLGYISCNIDTLKKFLAKIKDFMFACEKEFDKVVNEGQDLRQTIDCIEELKSELKLDYVLESIDDIIEESKIGLKKVSEVVVNLKNFAKNDSKNFKSEENVAKIIEESLTILNNKISKDIGIVKNFEEIPLLKCNKNELEQVFINIIDNACHAVVEKDSSNKKIIISVYKKGKFACIEIEDNGVGIEKNKINKIFETFYSTKAYGEGTGLGLSISYNIIVNNHNGELLVDSQKNKGTKFIIKIPY